MYVDRIMNSLHNIRDELYYKIENDSLAIDEIEIFRNAIDSFNESISYLATVDAILTK